MKVTASIVTYHTPLDEVLRAIALAEKSVIERLIVVDNSKSDAIKGACKSDKVKVDYIASENVGYGAAHNKALRIAEEIGSDYHLVMNTDIECHPADISKIGEFMESNKDVTTLQPRIVDESGKLQYTVRRLPSPFNLIGRRFLPNSWIASYDDRYLLKHLDHTKPINAPYHQGSFMFLRMSAIKTVGGFDERFFMYPEDIDLTRRLHSIGRTLYWPEVTIYHRHRAASYHSLRMLMIHCVNMVKYFNKWGWWRDSQRNKINQTL